VRLHISELDPRSIDELLELNQGQTIA